MGRRKQAIATLVLPAAGAADEWVGGRVTTPWRVEEPEPFQPDIILWCEVPRDVIVSQALVDPRKGTPSFAESFLAATRDPMIGPPRHPRRVRVGDDRLAAELRAVVGPDTEIRVAPTPEIDAVLAALVQSVVPDNERNASYFEGGRVPAATVAWLFDAAASLYELAPWKVAHDQQVLRLDIPRFDVRGACVSIIGALDESVGILIFPDLAGFEALTDFAVRKRRRDKIDLRTTVLSLDFERGADLPDSMRREIASLRWPVAGPAAFPRVVHRGRDGTPRPLAQRDVETAAACAEALAEFWKRERKAFRKDWPDEAVSGTVTLAEGVEVTLSYPYQAHDEFEPPPEAPRGAARMAKVGRNEPCPCGSGRKYKHCHLGRDERERAAAGGRAPGRERTQEVDPEESLVLRLIEFGSLRFGDAFKRIVRDFKDPAATLQLFVPWSVYAYELEGRPLSEWFLDEHGGELTPDERRMLEAQRGSWLSVWEVLEVEPGRGVTVRDLLTGATRTVREVSGSRTLVARDAILGRVVEEASIPVFSGIHPRPLPPFHAAEVVRRAHSRLHSKQAVPAERLRATAIGRFLIQSWEDSVETMELESRIPPKLQNTDGEALVPTVDRFDFEPGARNTIADRLVALEGVMPPEKRKGTVICTFTRAGNAQHKSWDNTVIGTARLGPSTLEVETNSTVRADALRRRIEMACGGLVRHRGRQTTDVARLLAERKERPRKPAKPARRSPAMGAAVRDFRGRELSGWLDTTIPALGGKTPREAARSSRDRARLDVLVKDIENREARLPAAERIDLSFLRRELGLDA